MGDKELLQTHHVEQRHLNEASQARQVTLTLSMLRLPSSKAQFFLNCKSSKSCHVGINWKGLIEY